MTDEQKANWDNEWKLKLAKDQDFENEMKIMAKYDTVYCDYSCKAAFDTELYEWSNRISTLSKNCKLIP